MKIDLIDLLDTREVGHPSTVTSVELREGNLRLLLSGYPWWRDTPTESGSAYEFLFQGVKGEIATVISELGPSGEPWDEALEDLSVQSIAAADWAQPQVCDLYCSEPLRDILALYVRLESHLQNVDSYFPPEHFLNCDSAAPLTSFARIAASNSFLLARVPESISNLLVEELNRQGVKHNILRNNLKVTGPRLRVRLGGCEFLCQSAVAILPD